MSWVDRLKTKWGITSTLQVVLICVAFSLAGMSVTQIRPIVWKLFGYTSETSLWLRVPTHILMIFPTYQVLLLLYGTLLGQFKFFWEKEKKILRFFAKPFRKKAQTPEA